MARWLIAVCSAVCVFLLCSGAAGPAFVSASPAGPAGLADDHSLDRTGVQLAQTTQTTTASLVDENFTSTEFVLTVYPNQSVRWTFEHKTPLTSDSRKEWFELYAERFRQNETDAYRQFVQRARNLTENGQRATGRQMGASAFRKNATVSGITSNLGVVRMSFTWSNFTRLVDGQHVIADTFRRGIYIGPNQSFVVDRGPALQFVSVDPNVTSMSSTTLEDSLTVTWEGERDFNDFRPRIVLEPATGPGAGTTDEQNGGPGNPGGDDNDGSGPGMLLLSVAMVLFALVFLAVAALAIWLYRNELLPGTDEFGGSTESVDAPPETDSESAASTETTEPAAPEQGSALDSSADETRDVDDAISDEQFLTDEDRVINILESEGGRMKQSAIVQETDWSKSKVSMLLSNMAEEGEISKLRVGRENIISLPGSEPDAAGSPFEDEDS